MKSDALLIHYIRHAPLIYGVLMEVGCAIAIVVGLIGRDALLVFMALAAMPLVPVLCQKSCRGYEFDPERLAEEVDRRWKGGRAKSTQGQ